MILFTHFISIFNTTHSNALLHYNDLRKTFFTALTSVIQTIYEALKKFKTEKSNVTSCNETFSHDILVAVLIFAAVFM